MEFLKKNNLLSLETLIKEQKLDSLDVLLQLTEENIKTYIPLLGDRIKLKNGLNEIRKKDCFWTPEDLTKCGTSREKFTEPLCKKPRIEESAASDDDDKSLIEYVESLPTASSLSSQSTIVSSKENLGTVLTCAEYDAVVNVDLHSILKENIVGKAILLKKNKNIALDNKDRNSICELVISYFLNKGLKLNNIYLSIFADKITLEFADEKRSTYYVSPIPKKRSRGNKPEVARGKLVDKHRNKLAALRRSLKLEEEEEESEKIPVDEDIALDIKDAQLWLKNNIEPKEEVIQKWNTSYPLRYKTEADTVSDFYLQWPILGTQLAIELVNVDFQKRFFSDHQDFDLTDSFNKLYNKVFELRKTAISSSDAVYQTLLEGELTTDSRHAIQLYLITCMVPPKGRTRCGKAHWKLSTVESRDGLFIQVKGPGGLEEAKKQRVDFNYKKGCTLQPYILLVGPSLNNITASYVIVNGIDYKVSSVLEALDYCFKSFHVLDAKYPVECYHLWYLFQRGIYEIQTERDIKITYLSDLI